ncbi:hypothetical protein BDZ85DRAFT_270751 [Elsinoe ampelina]|uniref:Uncharacterized protein n=1 Tax=Elsinoe ampelina TaxID=302913 RepID=A0A6A6FXU1_9PEZI|nr:hypothetical protein BDZ85DRAFT_270751 [Elsinoe ampelina]
MLFANLPFRRPLLQAIVPLLLTLLAAFVFFIALDLANSIYQVTQALIQLDLAEDKDPRTHGRAWLRDLPGILNAISCVLLVFAGWQR